MSFIWASIESSSSTALKTALYPPSAIPVQPDLNDNPFDTIVALRPVSSTSIAALEPAPPDPTINTSVLIFLTSILIPFILFINSYLYF